MSIQEIVKYATSTPHNTNPAVLKSMLEQEKISNFAHEVFSNPVKEGEIIELEGIQYQKVGDCVNKKEWTNAIVLCSFSSSAGEVSSILCYEKNGTLGIDEKIVAGGPDDKPPFFIISLKEDNEYNIPLGVWVYYDALTKYYPWAIVIV